MQQSRSGYELARQVLTVAGSADDAFLATAGTGQVVKVRHVARREQWSILEDKLWRPHPNTWSSGEKASQNEQNIFHSVLSWWWFQIFVIFIPIGARWTHFDPYFSIGLKPPPRLERKGFFLVGGSSHLGGVVSKVSKTWGCCWTPSKWPWTWLINGGDPNYVLSRAILQVFFFPGKKAPVFLVVCFKYFLGRIDQTSCCCSLHHRVEGSFFFFRK